nr:MAG: hypothetical protein [Caudoviricetes sp.]
MNEKQLQFINLVEQKFGKNYVITKQEIIELVRNKEVNLTWPSWFTTEEYRVGRGKYRLPSQVVDNSNIVIENIVPMRKPVQENVANLIPEKDPNFVSWGFYSDLKNIVKSKMFYPIFIFGESGFGKNMMVEQVCADLKRELIRFNFSPETDIVSLVGGPSLENGNIVFNDGPVIQAMKRGAVLFLDEFAKGHPGNMLILNSILEGKSYLNPHTGEYVEAVEGFNVIAASNSSGRGEDTGRFLEQILDTSLLERFPITVIQEPPTEKIQVKILSKYLDDLDFTEKLVKWATVIKRTFDNGGIDELISIRRLVHIAKAYKIFSSKIKAIELCTNRFDVNTRDSFVDLYKKIDANIEFDEEGNEVIQEPEVEKVPDYI